MENNELKSIVRSELPKYIKEELPQLMQDNEEVRTFIIQLTRQYYADKLQTENQFDILLRQIRDESRKRDEKWEAYTKKQDEKWEEQDRKWEEQNRNWHKQMQKNDEMFEELRKMQRKHESSIGALGARWGINSEVSFRKTLESILKENFGVKVINFEETDKEGIVFGHPSQIELDIIIKNGLLIICEIKSSISKADMFYFANKVRYYEKKKNKTANRKIVVSPMIDKRAYTVAEELGIECFTHAEDVE
jgi:hypothetical protein